MIRSEFSRLGLSPSFRIADTAEVDVLATSVMNETIDFFYETDKDFPLFTECFSSIRGQDALVDIFLNVSTKCASIPEGIEFLRQSAEQTEKEADLDFFDTSFGQILCRQVSDFAAYLCDVFGSACAYIEEHPEYQAAYAETFASLKATSKSILEATHAPGAYVAISQILASYKLPAMGRLKKDTELTSEMALFKDLRTALDKKIKDLYKKKFSKSCETIARAMHETAHHTQKLYELLAEYETRMDQQKKDKNFLTFSDIHRYALKLLVNEDGTPTEVALSCAEAFSEIYIDEYQDVDRVQDTIFRAISRKDNRFMVGDITCLGPFLADQHPPAVVVVRGRGQPPK